MEGGPDFWKVPFGVYGLNRHTFPVHFQVWDRRRDSSPQCQEALARWLWRCWWKTLSKQPRMSSCVPHRGSAWLLRPNWIKTTSQQQWHIPPTSPLSTFPTLPLLFIYFFYLEQPAMLPLHMDWKDDSLMDLFLLMSLTFHDSRSSHN